MHTTSQPHHSKCGEWKHDKTNWESCFTWPFVLYRFHCIMIIAAVRCGFWLLREIISHPRSTLRRLCVNNFSFLLLLFSSFASASATQFTVYSLFFGSFYFGMQDKAAVSLGFTHKPMRKVKRTAHKTENYLLKVNVLFYTCVCACAVLCAPATFSLITSVLSFLFPALFLETKTPPWRCKEAKQEKERQIKRNDGIINKRKMALCQA